MRWLPACLLFLAAASPGVAQQPVQPVVPYHGMEIFCHLLHHLRFQPLADPGDLRNVDPDETLIVVLGDLTALEPIRRAVADPDRYAWLIASDGPADLRPWNLWIPRSEVMQVSALAYRNNRRCPLLKDRLERDHPAFRGVKQGIATNGPGFLENHGADLVRLAAFDRGSFASNKTSLQLGGNGYMFGTHGDDARRILILAGQGVFINGMLAQPDNDNVLFALNALRWLQNDRKRRHALVISSGEVVTRLDLPLTGTPPIPLPPVAVLNQMLRELEDEGIPRRLLEEAVGPTNLLRIALILGTIGILFYGAQRLWNTRHRQENVPLIVGAAAPPRSLPAMEQRQRELLLQDNLWEPAQALARQWFLEHAKVDAPLWDQAQDAGPPPCRVAAGWLARQTLVRQVRQLWSYATRDPSRRVPVHEFTRLVALHEELTDAIDEGRLEFVG